MDNEGRKQSMDDEERKQTSTRLPHAPLDQVHSDFAIAMDLQEQERAFTILTTIESDSDEDEIEEDSSESNDDNDYEFSEGQDTNSDEDMEEDEIDPDELSYEELIELGEFIGQEKRGLSLNEISTCLHPCTYKSLESKTGIDRCVVCQMEYEEGELLAALRCDHPYHSECISKWLQINKICPICSTEVSSHKISKTV